MLHKLYLILLIALLISNTEAQASEFRVSAGYFNLEAKTSTQRTNLGNLGVYRFAYAAAIGDHFSFQPGYSLYVIGTSSFDLGYGLDLNFGYYPLSLNRGYRQSYKNIKWQQTDELRPFVMVSFYQRQYQSIQSTYAGLGLSLGADYQLQSIALFARGGLALLKGPFGAQISEITAQIGVSKALP
ncbi:MAG: hypothetical protein ACOH5I_10015 [Oligoflexus sp.]